MRGGGKYRQQINMVYIRKTSTTQSISRRVLTQRPINSLPYSLLAFTKHTLAAQADKTIPLPYSPLRNGRTL